MLLTLYLLSVLLIISTNSWGYKLSSYIVLISQFILVLEDNEKSTFKNISHFDHFSTFRFFIVFCKDLFYENVQKLKSKSIHNLHHCLLSVFSSVFSRLMGQFRGTQSFQNSTILCPHLHPYWLCQKQEYSENTDWSHLRSNRRHNSSIQKLRYVQRWCFFIFDWACALQYINNWMLENDRLRNLSQKKSMVLPQLHRLIFIDRNQSNDHSWTWSTSTQSAFVTCLLGFPDFDLCKQHISLMWKQENFKRPGFVASWNNKLLHFW